MHPNIRVGELINKEKACWKVIKSLFLPQEAKVIRGIPISSCLPKDKQIWALNSKGVLSVKSAYYAGLELSWS